MTLQKNLYLSTAKIRR